MTTKKTDESVQVPEEAWTAQMTGKTFIPHREFISTDYVNDPPERYEMSESDTY